MEFLCIFPYLILYSVKKGNSEPLRKTPIITKPDGKYNRKQKNNSHDLSYSNNGSRMKVTDYKKVFSFNYAKATAEIHKPLGERYTFNPMTGADCMGT